jgi:hypothetical protein
VISHYNPPARAVLQEGHPAQSIIKILRTTQRVIYDGIKYLIEKSKQHAYDLDKGTDPLHQKSIERINEILVVCWNNYDDNNKNINYFQKIAALKLANRRLQS